MSRPHASRLLILGSTGSIGTQTLDIVRRLGGRVSVEGLVAHRNVELLVSQCREFRASHVCLTDTARADALRCALGHDDVTVHFGHEGMLEMIGTSDADTVVVALAGAVGIEPTHTAIERGMRIALASKEVLVAAGEHTMALAQKHGTPIVPIDSEHSALFQCIEGAKPQSVDRLILTASGGPFRSFTREQMSAITPEQALNHPTWNMGGLVTINSATLMNKGLEIIEAHWLFGVPVHRIDVLVHPQSIVHSLAQFADGSVLAQLGLPDMRLPIQYALMYPERVNTGLPRLSLAEVGALTFEPPDEGRFPALALARQALSIGGTMPAVMNAANETAVDAFLKRRTSFVGMMDTVDRVMGLHTPQAPTLDNVLAADRWARATAPLYL